MPREGFLGLFDKANSKDFEQETMAFLVKNSDDIFEWRENGGYWDFRRDQEGRTLLHEAALHGNVFIMELIIDILKASPKSKDNMGRYIEAKDCLGWTPLFTAIANCKGMAAKVLKDNGADLFANDIYGKNILHHLIKNDDWVSILVLIPPSNSTCVYNLNQPDCVGVRTLDIVSKDLNGQSSKVLWALRFLGSLPAEILNKLPLEKDVSDKWLLRRDLELFRGKVELFSNNQRELLARVPDLSRAIASFSSYIADVLKPKHIIIEAPKPEKPFASTSGGVDGLEHFQLEPSCLSQLPTPNDGQPSVPIHDESLPGRSPSPPSPPGDGDESESPQSESPSGSESPSSSDGDGPQADGGEAEPESLKSEPFSGAKSPLTSDEALQTGRSSVRKFLLTPLTVVSAMCGALSQYCRGDDKRDYEGEDKVVKFFSLE